MADEIEELTVGRRSTEENLGTNSVGTAIELRAAVRVDADDHYAEEFRHLNCIGRPVVNPLTRRLVGVVNFASARGDRYPGMGALLAEIARTLEAEFAASLPREHVSLLQAFHASRRGARPVVALGDDLLLANDAAMSLLNGPGDFDHLRALCRELDGEGPARVRLDLASFDQEVTIKPHGSDGWLLEFARRPGSHHVAATRPDPVDAELVFARARRVPTLITGEPGAGRSSAADKLAGDTEAVHIRCADAAGSPTQWRHRLRAALSPHGNPDGCVDRLVVLDGIESLPPGCAREAVDLIERSRVWVALITLGHEHLTGDQSTLAARCVARVDLPPLRDRVSELRTLVKDVARRAGRPDGGPVWSTDALDALRAHRWPGNFHELTMVVSQALRTADVGPVRIADLPPAYQDRPRRALTALEQSERQVIMTALASCGGNKRRVASDLGMSRTTLYKRLRLLDIQH
ncbi:MAG: hypothetical protein ABS81_01095 [Pseudonocardia sp. SCN 72-86]|nr:MAG: hypothetical protein ABS81_01095 [Pseudonocardia sp. SCN 72-86]